MFQQTLGQRYGARNDVLNAWNHQLDFQCVATKRTFVNSTKTITITVLYSNCVAFQINTTLLRPIAITLERSSIRKLCIDSVEVHQDFFFTKVIFMKISDNSRRLTINILEGHSNLGNKFMPNISLSRATLKKIKSKKKTNIENPSKAFERKKNTCHFPV